VCSSDLAENNLGIYTDEQEADEIALEFMVKMGLPPEAYLEAHLNRFSNNATTSSGIIFPTEIDMETCAKLYKNNWKDENGNTINVPVANFHSKYHSDCFRIYNLDQEIKGHKYEASPNPPAFNNPTGKNWEQIINEMKFEKLNENVSEII
jgi:hypothetical protein